MKPRVHPDAAVRRAWRTFIATFDCTFIVTAALAQAAGGAGGCGGEQPPPQPAKSDWR